jgi:hypothetical protein
LQETSLENLKKPKGIQKGEFTAFQDYPHGGFKPEFFPRRTWNNR